MRLAGITVAVTRARHQADDLRALIEAEGGTALLFPTIEIVPPEDWSAVDRAIDALPATGGVIFTSPNAVSGLLDRMTERGAGGDQLKGKKVYAVGEATASALSARGVRVTAMPERFSGADLAKMVGGAGVSGTSFLFPSGNLAPDAVPGALRALGATVDAVVVYVTRPPLPDDVDRFFAQVRDGRVDWITFTSPSTVNNFAKLFPAGRAGIIRSMTRIAAIGPTTATAAADAGYPAGVVAARAGAKELVEAICERVAQTRKRRQP